MPHGDETPAGPCPGDAPPGSQAERPGPWSIGLLRGPNPLELGPGPGCSNPALTRDDVTDLAAEFVADPFLVREGGRWLLFFEVLPRGGWRGVIGLAESADGRSWTYRGTVLDEPFEHLSYPHVFAHDGGHFMTPEALGTGEVRLYRATRFPDRWEPIAGLVPGRHADPTIFRSGGRWWLFTCTPPERHATLRLYVAEDLMGPWSEHPRSPIVADDPRIARPAGRVFSWGGHLHRLAQECVPYYGTAVHAFRITRLTPEDYREELALPGPIVGPGSEPWRRFGMHHLDAQPCPEGGWLAAVDGR
jgi:hypothetical protein